MSSTLRPARGLLLAAAEADCLEPIAWCPVEVGRGLVIRVSSDALKAIVPEAPRPLRLPVCYSETVALCKALSCIPPTRAFSDAIWAAAVARVMPVPLVRNAEDGRRMATLAFSITHNDHVDKTPHDPGDLLADVGKDWLLDNGIGARGAVNYGWRVFDGRKVPRPLQPRGLAHDADHYDYSQVLRLVQREAELDGESVDLLDYLSATIQDRFLKPYR